MTEEAIQLLREWIEYYDGRGYSFRLAARSRELLAAVVKNSLTTGRNSTCCGIYEARYVPNDEETARMENNGET